MQNLYHMVSECDKDGENTVVTVLDGAEFGRKALFSNGKLVWESESEGCFSKGQETFLCALRQAKKEGNTMVEWNGTHVFCDTLGQESTLVICGGGHVSIPVIQIGKMMGCHVIVLEDRPKFANDARRAGADEVFCEPFEQGLDKVEGGRNTCFVIVTRGHRYDQECLAKIVRKPHAYIGMIGSRRRVLTVKQAVLEGGGDPAVLENVHTPIGLDIGAETPAEIGVAIMAEIIETTKKEMRTHGYSRDMLRALTSEEDEKKVLATIVRRRGSAPRETGTKMLVYGDGHCVGTIGGGCVETDIQHKALCMMRNETERQKLCHVDMSGSDAEEEGMVCGGNVDILLEVV